MKLETLKDIEKDLGTKLIPNDIIFMKIRQLGKEHIKQLLKEQKKLILEFYTHKDNYHKHEKNFVFVRCEAKIKCIEDLLNISEEDLK